MQGDEYSVVEAAVKCAVDGFNLLFQAPAPPAAQVLQPGGQRPVDRKRSALQRLAMEEMMDDEEFAMLSDAVEHAPREYNFRWLLGVGAAAAGSCRRGCVLACGWPACHAAVAARHHSRPQIATQPLCVCSCAPLPNVSGLSSGG